MSVKALKPQKVMERLQLARCKR